MSAIRFLARAALLITLTPGLVIPGQTARKPTTRKRTTVPAKPKTTPPKAPENTVVAAATTTPSGLTFIITRHGAGRQAAPGDIVSVHYTGLLGSGRLFDSSVEGGKPISFKLGAGRVIKGWDEGIAKLHVGDQATLIIPPDLGYGERGAGGVIPPGATLIFVVELVDAQPDAKSDQNTNPK